MLNIHFNPPFLNILNIGFFLRVSQSFKVKIFLGARIQFRHSHKPFLTQNLLDTKQTTNLPDRSSIYI